MSNIHEILPVRRAGDSLIKRGADQLVSLQKEINHLFEEMMNDASLPSLWNHMRSTVMASPAIDIVENDKDFRITAEIPGLKAKDIDVSVDRGCITLKGEKKQESQEEKEGYFRHERFYGAFERTIALPETGNLDKAEASVNNGLLTITVPKKAGTQGKQRRLEVKQAA